MFVLTSSKRWRRLASSSLLLKLNHRWQWRSVFTTPTNVRPGRGLWILLILESTSLIIFYIKRTKIIWTFLLLWCWCQSSKLATVLLTKISIGRLRSILIPHLFLIFIYVTILILLYWWSFRRWQILLSILLRRWRIRWWNRLSIWNFQLICIRCASVFAICCCLLWWLGCLTTVPLVRVPANLLCFNIFDFCSVQEMGWVFAFLGVSFLLKGFCL